MVKICDICGEKLGFRKGIPYYLDHKDLLLCESCVQKIKIEEIKKFKEEQIQKEEQRRIDEEKQRKEEEKRKKEEEELNRKFGKLTEEKIQKIFEKHKKEGTIEKYRQEAAEHSWNSKKRAFIDKEIPFRIISKELIVFLNESYNLSWKVKIYNYGEVDTPVFDQERIFLYYKRIVDELIANGLLEELIMEKIEKNPEEVLGYYNGELKKNSNNLRAWVYKGLTLIHLNNNEEAFACFKKASEIFPFIPIQIYDRILIRFPDFQFIWFIMGCAYFWCKKYEDSNACFDKALEMNPNDVDVWIKKADLLSILGRFEEAIACCDRALELEPENPLAHEIKQKALGKMK
jgi:tetratricopeptide (TPR) repeat protein